MRRGSLKQRLKTVFYVGVMLVNYNQRLHQDSTLYTIYNNTSRSLLVLTNFDDVVKTLSSRLAGLGLMIYTLLSLLYSSSLLCLSLFLYLVGIMLYKTTQYNARGGELSINSKKKKKTHLLLRSDRSSRLYSLADVSISIPSI